MKFNPEVIMAYISYITPKEAKVSILSESFYLIVLWGLKTTAYSFDEALRNLQIMREAHPLFSDIVR